MNQYVTGAAIRELRLQKNMTQLQLAEKLKTKVFSDPIREGIAVKEAQINRRSLFDYAPKATEDYAAFINELLEKEDKAK